jgi:hypothetical protein
MVVDLMIDAPMVVPPTVLTPGVEAPRTQAVMVLTVETLTAAVRMDVTRRRATWWRPWRPSWTTWSTLPARSTKPERRVPAVGGASALRRARGIP